MPAPRCSLSVRASRGSRCGRSRSRNDALSGPVTGVIVSGRRATGLVSAERGAGVPSRGASRLRGNGTRRQPQLMHHRSGQPNGHHPRPDGPRDHTSAAGVAAMPQTLRDRLAAPASLHEPALPLARSSRHSRAHSRQLTTEAQPQSPRLCGRPPSCRSYAHPG